MNNRFPTVYRALTCLTLIIICCLLTNAQNSNAAGSFAFPENGSEFTVIFPSRPNIREFRIEAYDGLQAELVLPREGCLLRAESMIFTPAQAIEIRSVEVRVLTERAMAMAEAAGLSNPQVRNERNQFGRFVTVRGNKTIEGVPATFEMTAYYGRRSMIILTVGAPSGNFPTRSVTNFLSSLRRN